VIRRGFLDQALRENEFGKELLLMPTAMFSAEQIVTLLRQIEVAIDQDRSALIAAWLDLAAARCSELLERRDFLRTESGASHSHR
jgi:hypothetical protein